MQKAIIVNAYLDENHEWQENGIAEVNALLEKGWKVVSCTPMGGASYGYAAAYGYPGAVAVGGESDYRVHCEPGHAMASGWNLEFASVFVLENSIKR